jgi:hypothetical protein
VGGGRDNVSGRYPSRKMGSTIQFESHRVELPFVYEMEHSTNVLEYYEQPPSLPLVYPGGGRKSCTARSIASRSSFGIKAYIHREAGSRSACQTEPVANGKP